MRKAEGDYINNLFDADFSGAPSHAFTHSGTGEDRRAWSCDILIILPSTSIPGCTNNTQTTQPLLLPHGLSSWTDLTLAIGPLAALNHLEDPSYLGAAVTAPLQFYSQSLPLTSHDRVSIVFESTSGSSYSNPLVVLQFHYPCWMLRVGISSLTGS